LIAAKTSAENLEFAKVLAYKPFLFRTNHINPGTELK